MSSTFSILFLAIGFVWKLSERGQLRYWLVASFGCYALAAFWAWYRIRPTLSVECSWVDLDKLRGDYENRVHATFILHLVNTRPEDNAIREYKLLAGSKWSPKRIHAALTLTEDTVEVVHIQRDLEDLDRRKDDVLEQGRPRSGWIRFSIFSKESVFGEPWTLEVIDVYGRNYKVRGTLPKVFSGHLRRIRDG